MGNGNQKEELHRTREDAARRDAEAREAIAREREESIRRARENQELLNRMHEQERNFSERMMDISREKDRQLESLQEEHLRLERQKDEDLKDAHEKAMQMNKEHIDRMESMEQSHRENTLRHQRLADEAIEKKDRDLKEAAEKILQVKKEDEERAERLLAEKHRLHEMEKETLQKSIDNKDRDLKQTFEKVVTTQKEGMEREGEIRKTLKREKDEEVSKVEVKLTEKNQELKQANEKILVVKKEGEERVDKILKEKQKELNDAVERVEVRHKEHMESMKDGYMMMLEAEKEHTRRTDALLQTQMEYGRIDQERMLQIKDQVNEETRKRLQLQSDAHNKVSAMYERIINENKQHAIQSSIQQSLQLMSLMSGMQQGQQQGNALSQMQAAMLTHQANLLQQINQSTIPSMADQTTPKQEKQEEAEAKPNVNQTPENQTCKPVLNSPPEAIQNNYTSSESSKSSYDRLSEDDAAPNVPEAKREDSALMTPDQYCEFISSAVSEICVPILARIDAIIDEQLTVVKQLKTEFYNAGGQGDVLPEGDRFWLNIDKILENHKSECRKQIMRSLIALEEKLKKSLTQLIESTKTAHQTKDAKTVDGIIKSTLQRSKNTCLEVIEGFGQSLNDNLQGTVQSYTKAIDSLNDDFRTVLTSNVDERITEYSKTYVEDYDAEVKRCQKKVARVLVENGETVLTNVKSKLV